MYISVLLSLGCLLLGAILLTSIMSLPSLLHKKQSLLDATLVILVAGLANSFLGVGPATSYEWLMMFLQLSYIFLTVRIRFGRLPMQFLVWSTRLHMIGFLLVGVATFWLIVSMQQSDLLSIVVMYVCLSVVLLLCMWLVLHVLWTMRHYATHQHDQINTTTPLPTVSLAIPARNENHALTDCLQAAMSSTYEKLEIIVLDDCSQDNTSQVVRSFAQEGVRFVQGDAPADGWLGKSHAYRTLAAEAQGDFVLFIGVDTILQPDTISKLVRYAEDHDLDMLSVLPQQKTFHGLSSLLPAWQYIRMILAPLSPRHIPVSSECWLIKRTTLQALGGFESVKHKIIPEGSFARRLHVSGRYRFLIANSSLPLRYDKKWSSIRETAIRLDYPSHKRQPLRVLLSSALLLLVGLGPFAVLFLNHGSVAIIALIICGLYVVTYGMILARLQPRFWWLSIWFLPLLILQALIVSFISLAKYEFGTVNWKGRNVCFPVLLHKRT